MTLDQEWEHIVISALRQEEGASSHDHEQARLERALTNLRKQHLWGDISDDEYRQEKEDLERQRRAVASFGLSVHLPNLERAAQLLADLPDLWRHPGVTDEQRERLVAEMFEQVRLRGKNLVAIEPKPQYQPLFACIVTEGIRKCRGERT